MKVIVIIGTRPEAIKMAPVVRALKASTVETLVCTTGQHKEMLEQALNTFSMHSDVALEVMSPNQTLNPLSAKFLFQLNEVLKIQKPDWILVQGDTTTAFCAGLAAFHLGIKVGHIEAGLRTGDLSSPFPEEGNRSLLSRITSRHFAPTQAAKQALLQENIPAASICITGNTVVDAIEWVKSRWEISPPKLPAALTALDQGPRYVLITCHRRENFGEVLLGICLMLKRLCTRYPNHCFVFPVHLNPNVRIPVMELLGNIVNLKLIDPVDYHTSLYLISCSDLIISDSGGIQEEAPSFATPVVVMRSHTERLEGVTAGFATLAGQDPLLIEKAACRWLDNPELKHALRNKTNPYGDGLSARRIVASLLGEALEAFHG